MNGYEILFGSSAILLAVVLAGWAGFRLWAAAKKREIKSKEKRWVGDADEK